MFLQNLSWNFKTRQNKTWNRFIKGFLLFSNTKKIIMQKTKALHIPSDFTAIAAEQRGFVFFSYAYIL